MDDRNRDYLDRRDAEIQRQEERNRANQERSENERLQLMRDRQERENQDNWRRIDNTHTQYNSGSGTSTLGGDPTDIYRSKSLGHSGGSTIGGTGSSGCSTIFFAVIGIAWFIIYGPEMFKKEFGLSMPADVPWLVLICGFLFWVSYSSRNMNMLKRIRGWICFLLGVVGIFYTGFIWYKMIHSSPISAPRPASPNIRKDPSGSSRRHKQSDTPNLQEKPLEEVERDNS